MTLVRLHRRGVMVGAIALALVSAACAGAGSSPASSGPPADLPIPSGAPVTVGVDDQVAGGAIFYTITSPDAPAVDKNGHPNDVQTWPVTAWHWDFGDGTTDEER